MRDLLSWRADTSSAESAGQVLQPRATSRERSRRQGSLLQGQDALWPVPRSPSLRSVRQRKKVVGLQPGRSHEGSGDGHAPTKGPLHGGSIPTCERSLGGAHMGFARRVRDRLGSSQSSNSRDSCHHRTSKLCYRSQPADFRRRRRTTMGPRDGGISTASA